MFAVVALVPVLVAGQTSTDGTYIVPRTIDGQPDLQGVWATTPQRPWSARSRSSKDALMDEELALLKERAAEVRGAEQVGNLLGPLLIQRLLDPENAPEFDAGTGNRSGPRIVDSVLSEISTGFQAAVFTATCSKYTASGVRRSSAV